MRSYRSLKAWQRAHVLCISTLALVDEYNRPPAFSLFDQLRRAAISVEANIVEGYALRTPNLLRRHLRIAVGSAAEVECLLGIATELNYLPAQPAADLRQVSDDAIGLLRGLMKSDRLVG